MTDLARARAVLKDVFGYDDFRPGQEEVVRAALAGEDVFAVMPTGSGKSMCFQLPAVVEGGLTLVVSPLIALMRDQVLQLAALGVAAASLNSADDEEARRDTGERLRAGEIRLLFVSPERLAVPGFVERMARLGLRRLVVDEAHCVSQWGHDFRRDYQRLARVRDTLGRVQVLAFTATADAATRDDIVRQLFPEPPRIVVHSFDRPNLALRFEPKARPAARIAAFVAERPGQSGIVYTASRNGAERLAASLAREGHAALAYHAGLPSELRRERQDAFLQEDGRVMVATVAFGMGINKPDVRFVVHADMPGGIESWYQEIGRAGRDGLPADTLTLYGIDDMMLRRRQIAEKEIGPERRRTEELRLAAMTDLCEVAACRRQALLAYFGESSGPCGHCDLCADAAATAVDATVEAQKALSAVARTGQRFGAAHLAAVLTGEATDTVVRLGHDGLKTFGVGRDRGKRAWQGILRQLFAAGALAETESEFAGFRLTERGEAILFGRGRIALRPLPAEMSRSRSARGEARPNRLAGLDEEGQRLFEALRAVRAGFAKSEGVAAFMVFPDRTLVEMATRRPTNSAELRAVQGVGDRKLVRYGPAFLAAIAAGP